jgi:hypothetical protein
MKDALQKGQDEVNSLIADHFKQRCVLLFPFSSLPLTVFTRSNALIAALQLDNNRPLSRIEPKGYQGAFSEQLTLTRQLVSVVDGYKKQLDPANEEFFDAAKHARQSFSSFFLPSFERQLTSSSFMLQFKLVLSKLSVPTKSSSRLRTPSLRRGKPWQRCVAFLLPPFFLTQPQLTFIPLPASSKRRPGGLPSLQSPHESLSRIFSPPSSLLSARFYR